MSRMLGCFIFSARVIYFLNLGKLILKYILLYMDIHTHVHAQMLHKMSDSVSPCTCYLIHLQSIYFKKKNLHNNHWKKKIVEEYSKVILMITLRFSVKFSVHLFIPRDLCFGGPNKALPLLC